MDFDLDVYGSSLKRDVQDSADFQLHAQKLALSRFLMDMDGKIMGILQPSTLGTTLLFSNEDISMFRTEG